MCEQLSAIEESVVLAAGGLITEVKESLGRRVSSLMHPGRRIA